MFLVWAYHYSLDVDATTGTFMRHAADTRGGMAYTFIDEKYTIVEINDNYRLSCERSLSPALAVNLKSPKYRPFA